MVRFFRVGGVAAAAMWAGLVLLFMSRAEEREADQIVAICGITLMIVLLATWAGARIYMDREMRRAGVEAGLCNNCGRGLPEGTPAFDGCVVCSSCKRAWRRSGAGAGGAVKA
jgi:hypothetical protein